MKNILSLFVKYPLGYLDPGTGSFVLQLIIAGIVSFFFGIKVYWNKIKALFIRKNPAEEESHE